MDIDTSILSKNKVLLLMCGLLVFLIIGGGWFLYERVMSAIIAIDTIPQKEKELKDLTDRVLRLDGIEEEVYQQRNKELIEVLPESVDLSLAMGGLVTILKDAKYEVVSGKSSDAKTESKIVSQSIIMKFAGNEESTRAFLERLAKVKPLMKPVIMEAFFTDVDKADYLITVQTYGWSSTQGAVDVLTANIPALDNQSKYEQLFTDIKSWEKIIPTLDFAFEGCDNRDVFKFGTCNPDLLNENKLEEVILSPTPTPVEEPIDEI